MGPANATAMKAPAIVTESLEDQLARIIAENEALKAQVAAKPPVGTITLKVTKARAPGTNGEKDMGTTSTGAISMYGLNKFPVTLREKQWLRVKEYLNSDAFEKFCTDHRSEIVNEKV